MTRRLVLLAAVFAAVVLPLAAGAAWIRGPSPTTPPTLAPPLADQSSAPPETASTTPTAISRAGLPDPVLTPGAANPAVTPATLARTICRSGWTATVRPPAAYTSALKVEQIVRYGYTDRDPRHYEEDHLIPLELGGAPRDPRNLWPEPLEATLPDGTAVGAGAKDRLENELRREVCAGTMGLVTAQRAIAGDWVAAWEAAGQP